MTEPNETIPGQEQIEPEPAVEPEPVAPEHEPEHEEEHEEEREEEPTQRAITPEEIEERARKSRNAFDAFGRKLFTIHEEYAHDLIECPMCPDMHKGYLNIHDAGRVPEDIKTAVMQFLGFAREVDYPHSSQHRTCQECDGLGKVRTGSRVPGKETVGCAACHGAGFIGPQAATGNGHTEIDPSLSGPLVHGLDTPTDEVDEWGEPRILPDGRENPNFGKMPHRKIQVEPWGTTAGLNALDVVAS